MAYRDLCKPCAEALRADGRSVIFVSGGRDHKVFCYRCARRRFGATYKISGRGEPPVTKKVKAHAAHHA